MDAQLFFLILPSSNFFCSRCLSIRLIVTNGHPTKLKEFRHRNHFIIIIIIETEENGSSCEGIPKKKKRKTGSKSTVLFSYLDCFRTPSWSIRWFRKQFSVDEIHFVLEMLFDFEVRWNQSRHLSEFVLRNGFREITWWYLFMKLCLFVLNEKEFQMSLMLIKYVTF